MIRARGSLFGFGSNDEDILLDSDYATLEKSHSSYSCVIEEPARAVMSQQEDVKMVGEAEQLNPFSIA